MPDVTVTSDIDTFLKSSNNSTARTNLGAESAPTSIANKEAAYALTGVAVGTVYKTEDTGQVMEYRGGGESLPTSWQFNVTVDGGSKNAKLSDIPAGNPAGIVRMVSTKTSNLSVTVKHDGTESATGICYSVDGGAPVYGAIAADTSLNLSIPHNGGAPTEIYIWSATSASSGKKGELTYLSCSNISLTSLDVSGLTALTLLYCHNNSLTSLDVSGLTALTTLYCHENSLTSLDVSGLTALTTLYCYNNSLTSLDVSGLTALTLLYCHNNSLTSLDVSGLTALTTLYCYNNSLTSLDVSGLTALTSLYCNNNSLTSLDVSGLTALTYLFCTNNSLTSLLATGVDLSFEYYGVVGSDIGDNDLTEAALIAFVDSLATTATGLIAYGGNIGSAEFETWLATGDDKGYIWLNS